MNTSIRDTSSLPPPPTPALRRLSPGLLLSIYGVVPVVCLFILADYIFFDLRFSRALPSEYRIVQWSNLFLQVPHGIASILTFLDREYVDRYRRRLMLSLAGTVLLVLFLPWVAGAGWLVLGASIYTYYHQIAQQAGIASLLAKNKSLAHEVWKWASFILVTAIFIAIFAAGTPLEILVTTHPGQEIMQALVIGLLAILVVTSVITARQSKTDIGKSYIYANSAMLFVYYGLYLLKLPLFMILMPRIVHDATAFAFYINHNTNRNNPVRYNLISRIRNIIPIPEYVLTPLAGVICGVTLATYLKNDFYIVVASFLNIVHCYLEGVMWKRDSLHRSFVSV